MTHYRAAMIGSHCYQLYAAIGKIQYLKGARVGNQLSNVLGDQLFGTNNHINRNMVASEQLFLVSEVIRGTHPRYLGGRVEQGVCYLAGHHVDFVGVGHRNQHIGVFCACLVERIGMRGAAGDGADIESVLQGAQFRAIRIDHGNVVLLAGEMLRQSAADLAGAENNNFHRLQAQLTMREQ